MSYSEKESNELQISINKSLNPLEAPLKVKHARAIIISTHHTRESVLFWILVTKRPLLEQRFTAWKFCHLVHKILREGHKNCLVQAQQHKKYILEIGKLWGHLTDGVGNCIETYTKLLVTKIDFHNRNPIFPGSLLIDFGDLEKLSENDINFFFQLAVEVFDYLDDIIAVEKNVFDSVRTYRMSSMTPQGQCRLAPLIPLIQDSNPLYDLSVRLMFRLHMVLPNDILTGHRARFQKVFNELKVFYDSVKPLQYFVDLIQVPHLPENYPNFSSTVDFGSYIPPVVIVPDASPDIAAVVDNLVDMNVPLEDANKRLEVNNFEENLIEKLKKDNRRLQQNFETTSKAYQMQLNELENKISMLHSKLAETNEELSRTRINNEEHLLKVQATLAFEEKSVENEKVRVTAEKFLKLKSMYTAMRDEHVKLLRQHADVEKHLSDSNKKTLDLLKQNALLHKQLQDCEQKEEEHVLMLEKINKIEQQERELSLKYEKLLNDNTELKNRYDKLKEEKLAESQEFQSKIDNIKIEMKLKDHEAESYVQAIRNDLENKQQHIRLVEMKISKKTEEYEMELEDLKTLTWTIENKTKVANSKLDQLIAEKVIIEKDAQNLLAEKSTLCEEYQRVTEHVSKLECSLQDAQLSHLTKLRDLIVSNIETSEDIITRAMKLDESTLVSDTSSYFVLKSEELEQALAALVTAYESYIANEDTGIYEMCKIVTPIGHLFASIQTQGMTICNTSPDIECGQKITDGIKVLGSEIISLFDHLRLLPKCECIDETKIQGNLLYIVNLVRELCRKSANSDQIGDFVETELAMMDKAIEEAAEKILQMLSDSKTRDTGVILKVNEKILDACTNLMENIRILVRKSKKLQAEIMTLGKGSAKDFYNRNHQWTEGLISAAKSVATGAKLLVSAADKAVCGESKHHFDIIVAAQEIAACTARLVVASRVKAPRDSINLSELSIASRNVTQATAALVAIAKDCSQHIESCQDIDFSILSVNQAKTMEMEIQVKILELEQALEMKRVTLANFRKRSYQNVEDM